jgi:hypothetical protein
MDKLKKTFQKEIIVYLGGVLIGVSSGGIAGATAGHLGTSLARKSSQQNYKNIQNEK